MANKTIKDYTLAVGIDPIADALLIEQGTAYNYINRNVLLGITGSPIGNTDVQTLTNKTLTSPTINGATLSGTLSGTYTIGGTPTFPSSVATLTGVQTLTNKTLASPSISAPTITNATLSADTITGFSSSTTGSIYGISVTSGTIGSSALASNAVITTAITDGNVTAAKLSTGAITLGYAQSTTNFTTTSTAFVDVTSLTTTVIVPSGGRRVEFNIDSGAAQINGAAGSYWGIALLEDGVIIQQWYRNTDTSAYAMPVGLHFSKVPTAGSHTYKVQAAASTGTFTIFANTPGATPANPGASSILVKAI